jgi:glycosyltransferase involved in cell wall biosynthesis
MTGRKVLMVSGDILPFCDRPVGGAGLRTWGMGEGLRHYGHKVIYALPEKARAMANKCGFSHYIFYDPFNFNACIKATCPEVIVFQNWTQVLLARHFNGPVAVDFHGPTMLEVQYQSGDHSLRKRIKLDAVRRADFFTCAGEYQRHYFWGWLMMAGIKIDMGSIAVIPVPVSPDLPPAEKGDEVVFVYGGTFLPWQNPETVISVLIKILGDKRKGVFRFYGGDSILGKDSGGKFIPLLKKLKEAPRVDVRGHLSHSRLINEYLKAGVAIDLMERSPERELAFTTRTIEYLWCGLPVIYNDYAELSSYIRDYQAGWVINPEDTAALKNILEKILDNGYDLKRYSLNAQRLVRDRFTWDRAVYPLAKFCSSPARRNRDFRMRADIKELSRILKYEGKKFLGNLIL